MTISKQSFLRKIYDIEQSLSAAAEYIKRKDMCIGGDEIVNDRHECLNLRFLCVSEYKWQLFAKEGPKRFRVIRHYKWTMVMF